MKNFGKMLCSQARWVTALAFAGSALVACSDDPGPGGGMAGSTSGGTSSTAGSSTGGSGTSTAGTSGGGKGGSGPSTGGTSPTAGTSSTGGGGAATGGTSSTGGGGAATGGGGAATGGGGAATGGGGSGGTGGGGASEPTAVANIMGVKGIAVTGTATFTQGATMTKLVLNLTACPDGVHSSHLHANPTCDADAEAAGGHWMPNGVDLGDYTCTGGTVTKEVSRPTSTWTVGDNAATDVTKHAFMVHAMGDDAGSGARIGCGVPMKK